MFGALKSPFSVATQRCDGERRAYLRCVEERNKATTKGATVDLCQSSIGEFRRCVDDLMKSSYLASLRAVEAQVANHKNELSVECASSQPDSLKQPVMKQI